MTDKIYSFLGLAKKAGKLVSGEDTCERAVKSGKAVLVIVAGDASENTKKRIVDACKFRDVEVRIFGEKEMLGRYVGKEIRSVIAVMEQGFAKRLMEMLDVHQQKCGGELIGKN